MTTTHVLPINDLIDHTDSEYCICGPTIEPIQNDDGTIDWIITHHSLDGRENHETEPEAPKRSLLEEAALPINFIFAIAFGFIYGATINPSREVTRWIILAVSSAYLAAMVAAYIHTRRNR